LLGRYLKYNHFNESSSFFPYFEEQIPNKILFLKNNIPTFYPTTCIAQRVANMPDYYTTLKSGFTGLMQLSGEKGRRLRHPKRFMAIPSPIVAVEWWRICLDEAQMVECTTTRTAEMALRLSAVNKWCVTGTPIHHDLAGKCKSFVKISFCQ
jgi:hypothetical protein